MRVLFLDVDGVINRSSASFSTTQRWVNDVLVCAEPEIIERVNCLVDRTGAQLVLSSSWRHMDQWRESMILSGIAKPFLDATPRYSDHHKYGCEYDDLCRGHNIQDWLDEHNVERYAIVDDTADMLQSQLPNFFKCDPAYGLTQDIADRIESHFGILNKD